MKRLINHNHLAVHSMEHLSVTVLALLLFSLARSYASVADELGFETSQFMRSTAYRHPERLAAGGSPSGAFSPVNITWEQTHSGNWYIEEQRYGADAVTGGIAGQDPNAIARGLKILHWGFEQQQPDGSFACPDDFHSTSFFVEASARACLLLAASRYGTQFAAEIDWIKPRALKAALWMIQPGVESTGRKRNTPYTHRRYLVAAALGETGVLCANQQLLDRPRDYIAEGISLQDPSGINPEKGGFDCNYQATGIVYAERYYELAAPETIKPGLKEMLGKANNCLARQVRADGTVDTSGSTRVGAGQEISRNGALKKISYPLVYESFYGWALISGNRAFASLAEKVFQGEAIYRHASSQANFTNLTLP